VNDEESNGRPSLVSNDFVQKVERIIREDRRMNLDGSHENYADVSRTVLYNVISKQLNYRKLCACWVPKMLTEEHKKNRFVSGKCFGSPTPHDLAPSDYHLFTRLKEALGGRGKRFKNDEELQQFTKTWLREVAGDVYEAGIQKLIPR